MELEQKVAVHVDRWLQQMSRNEKQEQHYEHTIAAIAALDRKLVALTVKMTFALSLLLLVVEVATKWLLK